MKRKAEENLETGFAQLRRWWSKKYNLPPNHELFESQSVAELNLEFFEELMVRRKEVLDELADEEIRSPDVSQLFKTLNIINKALGLKEEFQDDLVEEWERDLALGKIPDLNKG